MRTRLAILRTGLAGAMACASFSLPAQSFDWIDLNVSISAQLPANLGWPIFHNNFFKGVSKLMVQVGDLTGDGVPDVLLYNGFTFRGFQRMEYANTTARTGWQPVPNSFQVLSGAFGSYAKPSAAVLSCNSTFDITVVSGTTTWDLRHTSWHAWDNNLGTIADVDCDGRNEWIYLDWKPPAESQTTTGTDQDWREPEFLQHFVFMQCWKWNTQTLLLEHQVDNIEADAQIAAGQAASQAFGHYYSSSGRFFPGLWLNNVDGAKVMGGLFGAGHVHGVVAYTRHDSVGRHSAAYVWRNGQFNFVGFGGGIFTGNNPPYHEGSAGHHLTLGDVNSDGIEEICDKRMDTPRFAAATSSWSLEMQWTSMSLGSHAPVLFAGMTGGYKNHWDDICVGDYLESHLDAQGNVIPMPGVEVIATADERSTSINPIDWHGPSVWGGVLGHDYSALLANPQQQCRSPLRYLNCAGTALHDGEQYRFPSPGTSWAQPNANSHWDTIGSQLAAGFIPGGPNPADVSARGPDLQLVYLGNLIAEEPGFELGGAFKPESAFSFASQGPFMMFGAAANLPMLSFGHTAASGTLPGVPSRYVGDVVGGRSAQELLDVFSTAGTIMRFVTNGANQPRYKAEQWTALIGGANSNPLAADILRDGAEEVYQFFFVAGTNNTAHLRLAYDSGANRTHASPGGYADPFRDPLRQNPIDFERLDGLRFVSPLLIHGTTGVPYGVPLDNAVDPTAGAQFGHLLVPEGGDPLQTTTGSRYTVTCLTPLPGGLTGTFLPGNAAGRTHKGVLLLSGTPVEACWRELTFTITDNATSTTTTAKRWLHVAAGSGANADTAPRIEAVWKSRSVLASDADYAMNFEATVRDADGDFNGSFVLSETATAQQWSATATPTATPDRWAFMVNVGSLAGAPAGTRFHLTLRATDSAGKASPLWPYIEVPGANDKVAPWLPAASPGNNLRVAEVSLPAHTIQPAECFAQTNGTQAINARVEGPDSDLGTVGEALVTHVTTGVALGTVPLFQDPHDATLFEGTFTAPECWLGGGRYALHVRVQDANGVWSEWWPRLVVQ